ncbi:hypothetical protein DUNSADRAFT_15387 [Dunaliella salina]|uniref:Encoded protein n=1 Tax=Dunaliella salina TaxID=3046 RepID=A0ABQ7H1Y3_DUNSA|nr:hypothetical protein DUNSADRAFT_15387 [Dunaliella salina]|eukprot:KAF5840845.1 hypothetical protein DUNSADRAFT_15387 [Dunaliella salina]
MYKIAQTCVAQSAGDGGSQPSGNGDAAGTAGTQAAGAAEAGEGSPKVDGTTPQSAADANSAPAEEAPPSQGYMMNLAGDVAGKGLSMAAYLARSGAELALREDAIMYTGSIALIVLLAVGLMVGRRIVAYRSSREEVPSYQAVSSQQWVGDQRSGRGTDAWDNDSSEWESLEEGNSQDLHHKTAGATGPQPESTKTRQVRAQRKPLKKARQHFPAKSQEEQAPLLKGVGGGSKDVEQP